MKSGWVPASWAFALFLLAAVSIISSPIVTAAPTAPPGAGTAETATPVPTATSLPATATSTRTPTVAATNTPQPTATQAAATATSAPPTATRTRTPTSTSTPVTTASSSPVITGPPNAQTLENWTVHLAWNNPAGTTQVRLQLLPYNGDGPGLDIYAGSPTTSFDIPAPPDWYGLLPDMMYTWQIRTSAAASYAEGTDPSWSPWVQASFRTFTVTSSSLSAAAPAPGSTVDTLTPTLQWSSVNPRLWYFEVQLSRDPDFANAFVYSNLIHGGVTNPPNSYTVPSAYPLEAGTTYYWRVRPRLQGDAKQLDSVGNGTQRLSLAWSTLYTFRTQSETPSTVKFVVPAVLPAGVVGVPYVYLFCSPHAGGGTEQCPSPGQSPANPSGGNPPYHFEKEPGSQFWPFGLSLGKDGQLTGTPQAAGTRTFTICAIDLSGSQACATTSLTITTANVLPAPQTVTASNCTYRDHLWVVWSSVNGAAGYEAYRSTANSSAGAKLVHVGDATVLQFDDYAAELNVTYYYWVRAVEANGTWGDLSAVAIGRACDQQPAPAPAPGPATGAITFTITSASCRDSGQKPPTGWRYRYEIMVAGTASGPEGTQLNITPPRDIQGLTGGTYSSSWGDGTSSSVTRKAGQPAETKWTAKFYVDGLSDWYVVYSGTASHPDASSVAKETRKIIC